MEDSIATYGDHKLFKADVISVVDPFLMWNVFDKYATFVDELPKAKACVYSDESIRLLIVKELDTALCSASSCTPPSSSCPSPRTQLPPRTAGRGTT